MKVKKGIRVIPFSFLCEVYTNKERSMKLSQCMIVKNEEKNIECALSWGRDIVSEQIVVDTGSTDRTVEIAQKMGATVYHFPWINDFAAAKNFAIEQATGDWIAFLDADEYLEKPHAKLLAEFLAQLDTEMVEVGGKRKPCDVISCLMVHLDAGGRSKMVHKQTRFFRNVPHIRYQGVIHEQLVDRDGKKLVVLDVGDLLKIYHTGYAWTGDLDMQKGDRNVKMLENLLVKDPDSAELQLYMAESLGLAGDVSGACHYAQLVLDHGETYEDATWRLRAFQIVMIAKYQDEGVDEEELYALYRQACEEYPNVPDFDAVMGFYMFAHRRYPECVRYFEQALETFKSAQELPHSRMQELLKDTFVQLCMSYEELGDINKSFQYAVQALQIDPYNESILYPMLYKLTYTAPAPAEDILGLLKQLYDLSSRKDTLFLLKNIRKVTNAALEQCLKPYMAIEDQQQYFNQK